jgi:predicted HD phosphohydrolase
MKAANARATFKSMRQSTQRDWALIGARVRAYNDGLPDRVLQHLRMLRGDDSGYAVSRLEHSLQTATRAQRDGRDQEYVVCALLHDIGDTLGCYNHADIAAAILEPFVTEQNLWLVRHHAIFQGYYFFEHFGLDKDMREQFRDHPWFDFAAEFCERYDQNSFDPAYDSMSLDEFEPMLRSVLRRPRRSIYVRSATGSHSKP